METSIMQPHMSPEAVNQQFAEMTAPLEAEHQAAEIQAQENMMAMLGIAMRLRGINPELANQITGLAVVNRYAPQFEAAAAAAQQSEVTSQQDTAARDYHESDKKESLFV